MWDDGDFYKANTRMEYLLNAFKDYTINFDEIGSM